MVTHQDLLTYHNPAYHPTRETWAELPPADARGARRRARRRRVLRARRGATCAPRTSSRPSACASCRSASTTGSPAGREPRRRGARCRTRRSCSASAPTCATRTARSRSRCCARCASATAGTAARARRPARAPARRRRRGALPDGRRERGRRPRRGRRGREGVAVRARRRGRLPDDLRGLRAGAVRGRRARHAVPVRAAGRRSPRRCGAAAALVPWDADASADARARAAAPGPGARARIVGRDPRRGRAADVGPHRRRRWSTSTRRRSPAARRGDGWAALEAEAGAAHWEGTLLGAAQRHRPDRPRARRRGRRAARAGPADARRARPPRRPTRRPLLAVAATRSDAASAAETAQPAARGPLLALTRLSTTLDTPPRSRRAGRDRRPAIVVEHLAEDVPAPAPALLDAQGARAAPVQRDAATTSCDAVDDVSFEVGAGRVLRHRRPQRLGQEHAAEVPGRDLPAPTRATIDVDGPAVAVHRARRRLQPRPDRARQRDAQRDHARAHAQQARERFDEIIAFAELEEFVDLPLKNYSSRHERAARVRGRRSRSTPTCC